MQSASTANEIIQFAGFLSDYDPSLLFALTYDVDRQVSYLKVLKIVRRGDEEQRSYSFAEAADKIDIIESVKNNLIENGMQRRVPPSNDSYQVTVDADKQ